MQMMGGPRKMQPGQMGMYRFHHGRIIGLSEPAFDAKQGTETVSINSDLMDQNDQKVGELRVELRFDWLIEELVKLGWRQQRQAYLVDRLGRIILSDQDPAGSRHSLGEFNDPFELRILNQIRHSARGTVFDEGRPPKHVAGFYNVALTGWTIVFISTGSKILAPIIQFRNYYFLSVFLFVILVLAMIRISLARVVRPVKTITRAAQKVAQGDYSPVIESRTADEIGQLAQSFNTMVGGLRERDFILNTFGRYIDPEVARKLLRHPEAVRMGGDKRPVAILMADLRNFTPLAESLSPEETIQLVNRFFSSMITVVNQYEGIIVDFFGDSILVFFDSITQGLDTAASKSVSCALSMQTVMQHFQSNGGDPRFSNLKMGIGINVGDVVVGNMGSEARAKYGIVGSAVNATQRIQSAAQSNQIVVSQTLVELLGNRLTIERSFKKSLKGFNSPLQLYIVTGCRCD